MVADKRRWTRRAQTNCYASRGGVDFAGPTAHEQGAVVESSQACIEHCKRALLSCSAVTVRLPLYRGRKGVECWLRRSVNISECQRGQPRFDTFFTHAPLRANESNDDTPLALASSPSLRRWPASIPRQIYMSYRTHRVPAFLLQYWRRLHPGFMVTLYNDTECRDFIRRHYGPPWTEFFDRIPSGPIRADLWRVLLLHAVGGVYVDVDIEPLYPITAMVDSVDSLVTSGSRYPDNVNPHLLVSRAHEPILLETAAEMLAASRLKSGSFNYVRWSVCAAMYKVLNRSLTRPFHRNDNAVYSTKAGGTQVRIYAEELVTRPPRLCSPKTERAYRALAAAQSEQRWPVQIGKTQWMDNKTCVDQTKAMVQRASPQWPQRTFLYSKWAPEVWSMSQYEGRFKGREVLLA